MQRENKWQDRWREKYDIGSWVAPNGLRYTYSEIYGFIQSEINTAIAEERKRISKWADDNSNAGGEIDYMTLIEFINK